MTAGEKITKQKERPIRNGSAQSVQEKNKSAKQVQNGLGLIKKNNAEQTLNSNLKNDKHQPNKIDQTQNKNENSKLIKEKKITNGLRTKTASKNEVNCNRIKY